MPIEKKDTPKPFRIAGAAGKAATVKAAEGDGDAKKLRKFEGLAYTGVPMTPEGWWSGIIVDLAGVDVPDPRRPILRQHDHTKIVGHSLTVDVHPTDGITIAGVMSGVGDDAREVIGLADNGFPWQMSIGADPVTTEFLEAGKEAKVNGRTVVGPLTISRKTVLGEISFVPLGADGDTSATVLASKRRGQMFVKAALKQAHKDGVKAAAKFSDEAIDAMTDDEAKAALKECMKAEGDDEKPAEGSKTKAAEDDADKKAEAAASARIEARRKAEADESRRVDAIRASVKKYGITRVKLDGKEVAIEAHAIEKGMDPRDVELALLRASRPTDVGGTGPYINSLSAPEMTDAVLEAAVLQSARCELFHSDFFTASRGDRNGMPERDVKRIKAELGRRYTEQVQQRANDLFHERISLQQLLLVIASRNGYRGRQSISEDNLGEVAGYCARPIQADGSSTLSLPNLLSNVLNKFLLQGYLYTEQVWKEIAAIRSVKDFKPTKSVNLFGDTEFQDVGPNGELKHATLSDQAFANSVKSSGRMLTIPRTIIINDDLGGAATIPMMMGRGGGLKLNKVIWSKWLNPGNDEGGSTAFWATTHTIPGQQANANYMSGGSSALSSAALTAAVLLFDKQVDPAGNPLGVDPEILLIPSDLRTAAMELMNSQFLVYGGASASKQPADNIWKGSFKPVKSKYLNNAAYTGYSATAWWLLANPNIIPAIEVAFLNGQETPRVETAGPDFNFNTLGISTRAYFDMDANVQNFRAGVKSAGA